MANTKISALTSATTPVAGTEVLPIVQSSVTKQVSIANLTAGRAVSALSLSCTSTISTTISSKTASFDAAGSSIYSSYNDGTKTWRFGVGIQAAGAVSLYNVTDSLNAITVDTAGKIGFGTNTPATLVEMSKSGGPTLRLTNSSTASTVGDLIGGVDYYSADADSPAIRAYVRSYILDLYGRDGYLTFGTTATGGTVTECARFDTSGNFYVEVAATTASAANMFLDTTTTPSGQVKRSTSALKYKQDIRDLEDIDINSFRPVRYKSACEGDDQTVDHFGFIADWEDQAGHKELVSYGKNGEVEGFQYDRMTVVLAKVVQKQNALIEQLLLRVAKLES